MITARKSNLLRVAEAGYLAGRFARLGKDWEENCGENRDDRDYDE